MQKLIIDVREPQEYSRGHIEGAVNIPPAELINNSPKLANIPKDTEIILYCVTGSRSNASINVLASQGFTNLSNGINARQLATKYNLKIIS